MGEKMRKKALIFFKWFICEWLAYALIVFLAMTYLFACSVAVFSIIEWLSKSLEIFLGKLSFLVSFAIVMVTATPLTIFMFIHIFGTILNKYQEWKKEQVR